MVYGWKDRVDDGFSRWGEKDGGLDGGEGRDRWTKEAETEQESRRAGDRQ